MVGCAHDGPIAIWAVCATSSVSVAAVKFTALAMRHLDRRGTLELKHT